MLQQDLERAAKLGDSEGLQTILDQAGDLSFHKKELNKALLIAVQSCQSSNAQDICLCVQQLLSCGANINAEEPHQGKTALMIACEKGYIWLVETLLDFHAKVNHTDMHSRTPLFYVIEASAENVDVVQLLIKKGAELNATSVDGLTPLLKAT